MKIILFLLFLAVFSADVCGAEAEITPNPSYSAARESVLNDAPEQKKSRGGFFKRARKGLKRLVRGKREKGAEEPRNAVVEEAQARSDLRARVEKSRKGVFGKIRAKLGRSAAGRVCRPRAYRDIAEAQEHLETVRDVCRGDERNKILERFCTKQCSLDVSCVTGCAPFCRDWLETSAVGGRSRKRQAVVDGVRSCISEQTEAPLEDPSAFYDTFKSRLGKRPKKQFVSGEKDCKQAGKEYARGLLKACMVLHGVEEAVANYKNLKKVPQEVLKILKQSVKGFDEVSVPSDDDLTFDEIVRGFFERVDREARRHVEGQWSARHRTWTYDELKKVCRSLDSVVREAYTNGLGDYAEPEDDDDLGEYDEVNDDKGGALNDSMMEDGDQEESPVYEDIDARAPQKPRIGDARIDDKNKATPGNDVVAPDNDKTVQSLLQNVGADYANVGSDGHLKGDAPADGAEATYGNVGKGAGQMAEKP